MFDRDRKFVVFCEMEPDDRLALMLMSSLIQEDQILFVVTSLLGSETKAILLYDLLKNIGYSTVANERLFAGMTILRITSTF